MWIIASNGFFSVVQKPDNGSEGTLTIRARVRADLEELRDRYLPALGPISAAAGTDYEFRAKAPRHAVATALCQMASDIDYANFKDAVAERQGQRRAELYHELWLVLRRLKAAEASKKPEATGSRAYGGILLDDERRVLLRQPRGQFDGYVWTFPKGKAERGATPEETALREVKEETGYEAKIVAKLPGQFRGGTGVTEFFLMRRLGTPDPFDKKETEAIRWATLDEAPELVCQTRNAIGRKRDQEVLAAVGDFLRRVATRFSWKIQDMPAKRVRLPFSMRFSLGETARLRKGLVPDCMEDKWFVFAEEGWVSFHRSWTGFCIYRLRLEPDGECHRVAEAWVNRNVRQYQSEGKKQDESQLLAILHHLFAIGSKADFGG